MFGPTEIPPGVVEVLNKWLDLEFVEFRRFERMAKIASHCWLFGGLQSQLLDLSHERIVPCAQGFDWRQSFEP